MALTGKLGAIVLKVTVSLSLCLVLLSPCGRNPEAELVAAVPDIDRTMARRLVTDDDSTLARYARTVGVYPFRDAAVSIIRLFLAESVTDFGDLKRELLPVLERIATVYQNEFGCGLYAYQFRFWSELSQEDAVRIRRIRSAYTTTLRDTTLTSRAKADSLRRFVHEYKSLGYIPGIAHGKHETGNFLSETDRAEQTRCYREALAAAEEVDMFGLICQILGTMGYEAGVDGHVDSMFYYWNRSRDIAERHKIPDYAARIREFYANHYRSEGKLALAHDQLQEAVEVCGAYKGGYRELRFLVELVEFYNELGCWDISRRLLQSVNLLERKVPENFEGFIYTPRLHAATARARCLMAAGRIEEAESVFVNIKPLVRSQLQRDHYPRLLYTWSSDLLDNGRAEEALPLIEEGLARCEEVNYPRLVPKFHALRAAIEFEQEDYDDAFAALASFERATRSWQAEYSREWLTRDILRARILLALGNADSAMVELEGAFSRLENYLLELDASTHGYLWLEQCSELRAMLHVMTEGEPAAGYGAELYWRELYQLLGVGRSGRSGASSGRRSAADQGLLSDLRLLAARAQQNLGDTDRIHCVYYASDDRLYRFTATGDGIRRDKLSVPLGELRRLVTEVWAELSDSSADPEAPIPRTLITPLRALALQLLPREVLDVRVAKPHTLLVSTAGFLESLPFETLNLAADGSYRPLLKDWDVAYLRRARSTVRARRATTELLIADPALPERTRRRLSVYQPLEGASVEAATIAAHLEHPLVLDGARATKQRFTREWTDASLIYVAAHFTSNPEVPYLTTLPLAASGPTTAPDASHLDVGDVREADLGACDLVVLSGCATGAPYVAGETSGPGFGDAFLDAGAGAAVQTFWAVQDDVVSRDMSSFMRIWRSSDRSASSALSQIRRVTMDGPAGIRHPYFWAAYSIELGHL
jgi:tetratricopeptide (TPR) repeat protein